MYVDLHYNLHGCNTYNYEQLSLWVFYLIFGLNTNMRKFESTQKLEDLSARLLIDQRVIKLIKFELVFETGPTNM